MRRQVQLTAANQLAALCALIGTGQLQRPTLDAQQIALLIEVTGIQAQVVRLPQPLITQYTGREFAHATAE